MVAQLAVPLESAMAAVSSTSKTNIRALLTLIKETAEEAISEYDRQGFDLPSIHDTEKHPIDEVVPTLKLKQSLKTLEGACGQLGTVLSPAIHTMYNLSLNAFVPACINIAIKSDVASHLANHPLGLHLDTLAKQTSIHPQKLGTIMRLLVSHHCFREVQSNVFANNRLSLMLVRNTPVANMMELRTGDLHQKATLWLYESLMDPVYGPTYNPSLSPVLFAAGKEGYKGGALYDYLKSRPGGVEWFAGAMAGLRTIKGHEIILDVYPWKDLPSGANVCDLGGGNGSISMGIARKFPHINVTLQDRPETLEEAKKFWEREYPDALSQDRVSFVAVDFFKESPAPGMDIYYLSQIVHNWSDEDCVVLLKNIRRVMTPNSRVLIDDYIASHLDESSIANQHHSLPRAPYPLTPGFGAGGGRPYTSDFTMLIMCNARERSLEDFIDLCAAADLKFVTVWDLGETSITEFSMA